MKKHMNRNAKGFSLVEIMVAMAIFTIVAGAAFTLFSRHQALFSQQQDTVSMSLSLRNALNQMQIDMSNAGTGVFVGANVPNWPIGITVVNNNPGGGCYNAGTQTYGANCFDMMHILVADPNIPPLHPEDIGANCVSTTSSIVFAQPAAGLTPAQTGALFQNGDVILLVKADGSQMSAVTLTSNGSASGPKVQLQHNPTGADGTGNDPYQITTNPNNKLGTTFCNNDWLVKLQAITYRVDTATDPTNPRLVRVRGGQTDVVTDQIVGFRIGVSLWNQVLASSSEAYNYDASTYGDPPGSAPFDFTLIRSVRLMLIGRTRPNLEASYRFRNSFDNGPYQIQPVSLVVNPRNLSLRD